eukprot:Protomagalhaensia_wolfi_Nauph_80__184@NODE_10_length_5655_cov_165_650285_g7_i1_p6_GENE_NODE_10_length_5655_cov_165_650285_g7_i1NODE_10_length_5655_cov_165_650285_g7_i1_p6_ORF_typecomplete_len139_score15_56_NODE_10_length_5655_cov_165_650285_g7_i135583974
MGLRVLQLLPDVHVFGHTHFGWNASLREMLDGQKLSKEDQSELFEDSIRKLLDCRFIQAPLGYPRERSMRLRSLAVGPFNAKSGSRSLVPALSLESDGSLSVGCDFAYWSEHYKREGRHPENTVTADYVKQIYSKGLL